MITKELKRGKKHQEELGILLVGQHIQSSINLISNGLIFLFILRPLMSI